MDGNWPPFFGAECVDVVVEFNFNGKQTIKQAQKNSREEVRMMMMVGEEAKKMSECNNNKLTV